MDLKRHRGVHTMAATPTATADVLAVIGTPAMPGSFTPDCTAFEFPRIEYAGARGAGRRWQVRVRLLCGGAGVPITDAMLARGAVLEPGCVAEITVEASQADGKVRDAVPTWVAAGKNLGRANATNALTQALREACALHVKQQRRGGPQQHDRETAVGDAAPAAPAEPAGPAPAGPPPMLLSALGASKRATLAADDFRDGVTAQRKLNGVRLVAFLASDSTTVVFYSRTGLKYPGLSRVAADLRRLAAAAGPGPAGAAPYFDGELYVHGRDLAWISGQARRADDDASLVYHLFDVFFPAAKAAGVDTPYRERRAYLDAAFAALARAGWPGPLRVAPVAATPVSSADELAAFAAQAIADGYEGAVARRDGAGYTYSYRGYHSADALKIKPTLDAEFRVVGFGAGQRGKDAGALIWECATAAGRRFTVVPKNLTLEARRALYRCLSAPAGEPEAAPVGEPEAAPAGSRPRTRFERDLAGRLITLEYRELSADEIPLQAKAVTFRTYENGAGADPWAVLLHECAGTP